MITQERIVSIQVSLKKHGFGCWLLFDHGGSNDVALTILGGPQGSLMSRPFFYCIPAEGVPVRLVSRLEEDGFRNLPGRKRLYLSREDLHRELRSMLVGMRTVAMEYSPLGVLPSLSCVDAGTIDLVRSCGVAVVSSADLLGDFLPSFCHIEFEEHKKAEGILQKGFENAWGLIRERLARRKEVGEFDVCAAMLEHFQANGALTEEEPICAVNAHSADPHYQISQDTQAYILPGDFILLDLWCKTAAPRAIFADYTEVAVAAKTPTLRQTAIFHVVREAQERALELICDRFAEARPLRGFEVDQCCRKVIAKAGYGEYFVHRTGHDISQRIQGHGTHLDSFETHDDRVLRLGSCFTVGPGLYLPGEFGLRLEVNVFIKENGEVFVSGLQQDRIHCLYS